MENVLRRDANENRFDANRTEQPTFDDERQSRRKRRVRNNRFDEKKRLDFAPSLETPPPKNGQDETLNIEKGTGKPSVKRNASQGRGKQTTKTPTTKKRRSRTAGNALNVILRVKNQFFKFKKTPLNLNLKRNASYKNKYTPRPGFFKRLF